jgi:hypothetical protein
MKASRFKNYEINYHLKSLSKYESVLARNEMLVQELVAVRAAYKSLKEKYKHLKHERFKLKISKDTQTESVSALLPFTNKFLVNFITVCRMIQIPIFSQLLRKPIVHQTQAAC